MRDVHEAMEDKLTQELGISIRREYPALGNLRNIGRWGRLSRTPTLEPFPAYPPGTHTREVAEELGLADRVDELLERGTLAAGDRSS